MRTKSVHHRDPSLTPRERSVLTVAAAVLTLVPWSWGGSVPWTLFAGCGFSLAALLAAVGTLGAQRVALLVWGALLGASFAFVPGGAPAWSAEWLDWTAFPLCGLAGSAVAAWLMRADLRSRTSTESRADLWRFTPFWAGLAFAAYVVVQALNPWVRVDDVEGFWKAQGLALPKGEATHVLRALDHVAWLPSGVAAPFSGGNRLWFGMNAWRVLVTLAGPWMLFCALAVGLPRRRGYVALGWISVLAAVVVGAYGLVNQVSRGTLLGVPVPTDTTAFGTFFARTHAAVYLYLHVALALALGFWHLRRSAEHASLGGPHLIAGFVVLVLAAVAAMVNSMGAVAVLALLFLVVLPFAWKVGLRSAGFDVKDGAFYAAVAALFAALALLSVADFGQLEKKLHSKLAAFSASGTDDRAPYRRATWAMATEGGLTGRVWCGWGAGSYRWISPPYQAAQPELLRKDGSMRYRAHYAHNDWLQLLAEVGILGSLPALVALGWLLRRLRLAFVPGRPEAVVLGGSLLLFALHAWFDLLVWFTPVLYALALVTSALLAFLARSSSAPET